MKTDKFEEFYTYDKGRKCQNPECDAPIPDQAHGLRLHCPREVLPDGSIKSCKDDSNTEKRKVKLSPYKELMKHYMTMDILIRRLLRRKGERVTLEDINRAGINLSRPAEFQEVPEKNERHYYYVKFLIIQSSETYKITRHGRVF